MTQKKDIVYGLQISVPNDTVPLEMAVNIAHLAAELAKRTIITNDGEFVLRLTGVADGKANRKLAIGFVIDSADCGSFDPAIWMMRNIDKLDRVMDDYDPVFDKLGFGEPNVFLLRSI